MDYALHTPKITWKKKKLKMDLSVCCNNGGEADDSQQMQQNLDQLRFCQKN